MNLVSLYSVHLTRHWSAHTVRLRSGYIRRMADSGVNLRTATTDDLTDYLNSHPEWKPKTRAVMVDSMRSFYRWAASEGHIPVDPSLAVRMPRVPRAPARVANPSAIRTAFDSASLRDRAMLLLGAECGLRAFEIAKVNTADRDGRWLTVEGKAGTIRVPWLSPELLELLRAIEAEGCPDGWYFHSREGGHLSESSVYKHIRAVAAVNTHALRHLAGTNAYRGTNNDLRLTQEFLGHASPTTTALYVHIEQEDMKRASEATRLFSRAA